MEKTKEKDKLSFKEKLSNYWYYYKWQTLVFGLIIIFVVIASVQMFSNHEPDVGIAVVGKTVLTSNQNKEFKDVCDLLIDDFNGDGHKTVNYLELTVNEGIPSVPAEQLHNEEAIERFNVELVSGYSMIYMVNEEFYKRLKDRNMIIKLSEVLDADSVPAETVDEYGVYLKELDISFAPGFRELPGKLIICMLRSPAERDIKYGITEEYWQSNKIFLQRMFNYKYSR